MRNEVKFKEYMTILCEIHDRTLSKILTDLYWKVLAPFEDDECEAAFKEIIHTGKYFPKPADFMEILRGTKSNQATSAWLEVLAAVKRVGHYRGVRFLDPTIHYVIEAMGGWVKLAGEMTADDQKWKQKEFEKLYEVLSHNPREKCPEYLPGWCELQNRANGYAIKPEIVQVGCENRKQITGA